MARVALTRRVWSEPFCPILASRTKNGTGGSDQTRLVRSRAKNGPRGLARAKAWPGRVPGKAWPGRARLGLGPGRPGLPWPGQARFGFLAGAWPGPGRPGLGALAWAWPGPGQAQVWPGWAWPAQAWEHGGAWACLGQAWPHPPCHALALPGTGWQAKPGIYYKRATLSL